MNPSNGTPYYHDDMSQQGGHGNTSDQYDAFLSAADTTVNIDGAPRNIYSPHAAPQTQPRAVPAAQPMQASQAAFGLPIHMPSQANVELRNRLMQWHNSLQAREDDLVARETQVRGDQGRLFVAGRVQLQQQSEIDVGIREHNVSQRERAVGDREQAVVDREEAVTDRERAVADREERVAQMEKDQR